MRNEAPPGEYWPDTAEAMTRRMLWDMLSVEHPKDALKLETPAFYSRLMSPEARKGIDSFLEKRPPKFPGKVSKDMPMFSPKGKEGSA